MNQAEAITAIRDSHPTLQFRDLNTMEAPEEALTPLPSNVAKYRQEFDAELSDEELSSPQL